MRFLPHAFIALCALASIALGALGAAHESRLGMALGMLAPQAVCLAVVKVYGEDFAQYLRQRATRARLAAYRKGFRLGQR